MAHPKQLSPQDILKTAVRLVAHGDADGLSLRAVAAELGVKAPSLYRYFPDKEALEIAVAEAILSLMLVEMRNAPATSDPTIRFENIVDVYLRFARDRFPLYEFVMQHRYPKRYASGAGKAVWDLMVSAASAVSGLCDDTAAAVATWAFLHGYATLEHSGAFGLSGPKGGLERGVQALLSNFRESASAPKRKATGGNGSLSMTR